jgi:hypothetical protein
MMKKFLALFFCFWIPLAVSAQTLPFTNPEGFPGTGGGGGSGGGVSSFTGDGTVLSNSASTGAVIGSLANAGAKTVLGNPTGSSAAPVYTTNPVVTSITATTATTPVTVQVYTTDTYSSTVTFNLATSNWHQVTLTGNPTLALSNPTTGQQFSIQLTQDGTGSRTVTWFSGILWPGGTVPTLTTTANKNDVFTFKCTGSGVYLGFIAGQNM